MGASFLGYLGRLPKLMYKCYYIPKTTLNLALVKIKQHCGRMWLSSSFPLVMSMVFVLTLDRRPHRVRRHKFILVNVQILETNKP